MTQELIQKNYSPIKVVIKTKKKYSTKNRLMNVILNHNPLVKYSQYKRKKLIKNNKIRKADESFYFRFLNVFKRAFNLTNDLTIIGAEENIPKIGNNGYLMIANHQYFADPCYISSSLITSKGARKIRWISKIQNFSNETLKILMKPSGTIPLSLDRTLTNYANKEIVKTLKRKDGIGIFPEGTRNKKRDGSLLDFHLGAAKICIENNVPYVPVGLIGEAFPFKGKVEIVVGRPIFLEDNLVANYETLKVITHDMRTHVQELLNKKKNISVARLEKII